MMGALVRMEFYPQQRGMGDVPPQVVLRKVFNHEEDTRLDVSYQDESIGFCKVEIAPIAREADAGASGRSDKPYPAYRVHSDLNLTLSLMGTPSRLRLVGDSIFNNEYEIESFHLKTDIGEGRIDVRGDSISNTVTVDFEIGDMRDHRVFDFAQVRGAGLASAMGLPGLANFSFFGGGGMPTAFNQSNPNASAGSATTIILTDLRVGDLTLRTYQVESRMDQNMWARLWVSERGEVLKVETSFGLTMLADVLTDPSRVNKNRLRTTSRQ